MHAAIEDEDLRRELGTDRTFNVLKVAKSVCSTIGNIMGCSAIETVCNKGMDILNTMFGLDKINVKLALDLVKKEFDFFVKGGVDKTDCLDSSGKKDGPL